MPTTLHRHLICLIAPLLGVGSAYGDTLLYSYDADVPPYDESAGWIIANACEAACSESLADGHFLMRWVWPGDIVNFDLSIAEPGQDQPPTLWVEWRFRSDHAYVGTMGTCDARFSVHYGDIHEVIYLHGDAAESPSGRGFVGGLDLDAFNSFRFESLNGLDFRYAANGGIFFVHSGTATLPLSYLQFGGLGFCTSDKVPTVENAWDFVRYGTIEFGERIVACDPQDGLLDARLHFGLDRFTVTFNEPNFVYIDQISVATTAGDPPIVLQTRRLDNGPSETVEVVLDRPIPFAQTTTFTFDDGVAINVVEYTFAPGDTDGDGDADLRDFAMLQRCFRQSPPLGPCRALDLAPDELIDPLDVAAFVRLLEPP